MISVARFVLFFFSNLLLFYLYGLLNHALSGLPIYWILIGPMLILPAGLLSYKGLLLCIGCTGLWLDASIPSSLHGFFTINLLLMATLIHRFKHRFRFEHNYHPVLLAFAVNAYLMLALSIGILSFNAISLQFGYLFLISFVSSQITLLVVSVWFFNFQRCLITYFQLIDPLQEN